MRLRNLSNYILIFDAAGLASLPSLALKRLSAIGSTQNGGVAWCIDRYWLWYAARYTSIAGSRPFCAELYAVAALVGAAVVVAGHVLDVPPGPTVIAGGFSALASGPPRLATPRSRAAKRTKAEGDIADRASGQAEAFD